MRLHNRCWRPSRTRFFFPPLRKAGSPVPPGANLFAPQFAAAVWSASDRRKSARATASLEASWRRTLFSLSLWLPATIYCTTQCNEESTIADRDCQARRDFDTESTTTLGENRNRRHGKHRGRAIRKLRCAEQNINISALRSHHSRTSCIGSPLSRFTVRFDKRALPSDN